MKLYRNDIITLLEGYNFDKEHYIVISGSAMVLLGLKEYTSDIDIAVTQEYYDYLLWNYDCLFERTNEFGNGCYMIDDIINFGTDFYNPHHSFAFGIPVQTLEDLITLKTRLGRDKDQKDLELIKRGNI